jgi:hypothetical protein
MLLHDSCTMIVCSRGKGGLSVMLVGKVHPNQFAVVDFDCC